MALNFNIAVDILRKALHARKHPGISSGQSLVGLALQGLPYVTSLRGNARPPKTIYWSVNSVCNLHCKMCDVGTFNEEANFFKNLRIDRKLHEISLERFRSVTDEVADFRPMFSITATEPLMYKPLGEAIAYARHRGLEVAVTTGGYDLLQRAEELAEAGLTRLNVSIDGPPTVHNQIRGRKDVFARATSGIVKFYEAARRRGCKPEIICNFTIINMNYNRLEEFFDSVRELPVLRFNFTYMSFVTEDMAAAHNALWGHKYRASINSLSEEVRPGMVDVDVLYEQMLAVQRKGGDRVAFLPFLDREQLRRYFYDPNAFMGHLRCMSSWVIAQILADGEVIPYTRCYHVPFGNINESAFMDIWNGEAARRWRRDLRAEGRFPACTRCDMVY
jgi:MoaA/NifB/PqqE/SkfB family radical SAM enzyme